MTCAWRATGRLPALRTVRDFHLLLTHTMPGRDTQGVPSWHTWARRRCAARPKQWVPAAGTWCPPQRRRAPPSRPPHRLAGMLAASRRGGCLTQAAAAAVAAPIAVDAEGGCGCPWPITRWCPATWRTHRSPHPAAGQAGMQAHQVKRAQLRGRATSSPPSPPHVASNLPHPCSAGTCQP